MARDVNNIANVNSEEEVKEYKDSSVFNPTDEQITTIIHSLNTLNQVEILNIIGSFNISIDRVIVKKKMELIQYLIYGFKKGMFNESLFNELRSQAFNPEIDSTDGFFFSFGVDAPIITKEGLDSFLKNWNEVKDDKAIEFLEFKGQSAIFLVTKHTEKFIFDQESMFSIKYNDEKRAKVEVHFDKSIVYVQTTNTVIYNAIKTIIKEFLQDLLDIEKLVITPPKMSKNLSLTFNNDFTAAIEENSVHPNTIKLLDILLELDAPSSSFSGFECVNITLDHEDTINRRDAKSKIVSQNYGGGDLLKNKIVKDLILSNRIIYEIEFIIEYNHVDNEGNISKQLVTVGIINDRKSSLRIFIKNSDYNIRHVIKNAYSELTGVFISNYGQSQLRNEDNIKKLLGLS
ncbi:MULTISPECIES: hypothetical protein [Bacillus]|uniref:hypothetical protein n=1 Tax=Bacillus TaxID=1386 RepID=UPI0013628104|nr:MULTISPECIES: hypothetical protein [Bacillus]MBU8724235.1 hypothetical protein [Bacillus subtilis]MCL0027214.1 hypothetical protein [Bacillus sp. C21]MCL8471783.1 hypothetical protein [Bacillus subtilis]MCM3011075.1 hypothetical protein [Bacillus subtilis]MDK8209607.1 hypothetical protein [Bacillus subtilis]